MTMRYIMWAGAMLAVMSVLIGGCRKQPQATALPTAAPGEVTNVDARFTITSSAFVEGERLPTLYTADGRNVSPPLAWKGAPEGVVAFALIMDDPDAPRGTFTHWVLYGLAAATAGLPEAVPTKDTLPDLGGARQGLNDMGKVGYYGPSPPPGKVHHYRFTLYALGADLHLPPRARKVEVEKAMRDHLLGQARLVGTYSR